MWIPANSKMEKVGLSDSRDAACAYLERTVGHISPILQAFLDHGDRAIGYLEDQTAVRFKPVLHYPDYYPDFLGATLGGRVLEPVPFTVVCSAGISHCCIRRCQSLHYSAA